MKILVYWFGSAAFLLFGQYLEGGHVSSVLNLTTAVIVFAPVGVFLLSEYGAKGFAHLWARLLRQKHTAHDSAILEKAAVVGMFAGAVGSIFGMIQVFEHLTEVSKLGAGVATTVVSCLYGLIPAMAFIPFMGHEHDQAEAGAAGQGTPRQRPVLRLVDKKAAGFYSIFVAASIFGSFFVVLYATKS